MKKEVIFVLGLLILLSNINAFVPNEIITESFRENGNCAMPRFETYTTPDGCAIHCQYTLPECGNSFDYFKSSDIITECKAINSCLCMQDDEVCKENSGNENSECVKLTTSASSGSSNSDSNHYVCSRCKSLTEEIQYNVLGVDITQTVLNRNECKHAQEGCFNDPCNPLCECNNDQCEVRKCEIKDINGDGDEFDAKDYICVGTGKKIHESLVDINAVIKRNDNCKACPNNEKWQECGKFCCDTRYYTCGSDTGIKYCEPIKKKCEDDPNKKYCSSTKYPACCDKEDSCGVRTIDLPFPLSTIEKDVCIKGGECSNGGEPCGKDSSGNQVCCSDPNSDCRIVPPITEGLCMPPNEDACQNDPEGRTELCPSNPKEDEARICCKPGACIVDRKGVPHCDY